VIIQKASKGIKQANHQQISLSEKQV